MRFYHSNIQNFASCLDKIERLFAFKYEVSKDQIALVIKSKCIHVMVDGKLKESLLPSALIVLGIDEETGTFKKVMP